MNAAASVSTCSTFPLHSVTSVQETKQNKKKKPLVEMGHPLTSCVVVEEELRGGRVCVCVCVCVCVRE